MNKKLYNAKKIILIIASFTMMLSIALGFGLNKKVSADAVNTDWLTGNESISYVTFDEYENKVVKDLTSNTSNGIILSDSSTVVSKVKEILSNASTYMGKIWIVVDTDCKLTGTLTIDGDINFVITSAGSLDISEVKLAYTKDSANLSIYYSIDNENSDSPFDYKPYKEKYLYVDKTGKQEEKWVYNYRLYPNDPTSTSIKEQVHYISELNKGGNLKELVWDTWWIVDENYTFDNGTLKVGGFNNIILKNGCNLTVNRVTESSMYYADKSLNIYAETLDQTLAGSLKIKDGVDMEGFIPYGFNVYSGNVEVATTGYLCVSAQNNYDCFITVYGGTLRLSNSSSGYIMYNPYQQYSSVKLGFNLGDNVKIYDLLTDTEISDIDNTTIYEEALGDYLFSFVLDSDTESADWLTGDESIPYVTFDEEGNKVVKDLTRKTPNGVILSDPFTVNEEVEEILSNASTFDGKIWIVIDTGCKLSGTKQIDGDINFVVTSRGSLDLTELKLVYSKESANFSVYYSYYHENSDSPFYFKPYKEKYLFVNAQGETEEKWIYNSTSDYYAQRQVHYISEMVGNNYVESGYNEWWVVDKNYTLNKTLWICGLNNIILKDGYTLTVEDVASRSTFNTDKYINIYAQSLDTETAGSFVVKEGVNLSGIMADGFNIYGGNVSVYGGEDGCIVSSNQYDNSISVYGGLLYLKCLTCHAVYGSIRNFNLDLGNNIKIYDLTLKSEITHDHYQKLKSAGEFVIGDISGTTYEDIMNEGKYLSYVDYDEDGNERVQKLTLSAKNVFTFSNTENGFEEMTATLVNENVIDKEIWFIIEGEVTVSDSYKIDDKYDVKIILTDGAKLTFEKGIYLTSKNSLSIYATSSEKAVMGEMFVNNKENMHAIGDIDDCGTFNVYGGNVLIKFDESKGSFGEGATVNVLGGVLTVEPKPSSELGELIEDDDYFIFEDEEYEYLTVDEMGESVEKTLTIDDGYVFILTDTLYVIQNLEKYFGYSAYEENIWLVLSDSDELDLLNCYVSAALNVYKDLNILLLDGAEITFTELYINKDCRLNVYAQSTDFEKMGVLNLYQVKGEGILTVYGGRVNALAEYYGAPLSKNVAVYGGLLRAVGEYGEGVIFSTPFEECTISTGVGIFAYTGESLDTSNFYGTGRLILTSRAGIDWYKRESSQYAYSYKDENGVHQCYVEPFAIGKSWKVYSGKVTEPSRVYISDTVNILLTSGCEVTFNKGIDLGAGETLNFYSQTESAKFAGKAHIVAIENNCEIGIGSKESCGTVNFYGGVIDITATNKAIGHTKFDSFEINFYGGFVTLTTTDSYYNVNTSDINIHNDLPVYDVDNGIYRISSDPIESLKNGETVAVGNSSLVKLTSTINGITFEDAEDFERYLMQNPDLNVYEISLGFDVETISTIKFNGNITIDLGGFNWTFACPNYKPAFKSTAKWGTFTLLGGETKDHRSTLEASSQSMCSFLETGGNVHIENAIFKNFYANEKGALINGSGDGTINIDMQNVDVIGCYAKSIGGAIFLDDYNKNINSNGTMINLTCCKFENCYAESGGAIYIYDGTTIIKGDNTEFLGCHATNGSGGAIAVVDREGRDSFYYYGHAWDRNPNYCYISGFTFTNCFAGYSVKGVAVFSDIVAHRSGVFNGGAIYTHAGGYNVRNCDFQNCMAGNCGGGIFVEPWNPNVDNDPHALWRLPYVENCRFNECKAANNAYDIFLVFPKLWNINATAKVSDCTFVHSDSIKLCSTIGVGGSLDGVSKSMMILGNEVINQNNTASQSALVGSAVAGGKLWVFIPLLVVISGAVVGVVLYRKKKTTNK